MDDGGQGGYGMGMGMADDGSTTMMMMRIRVGRAVGMEVRERDEAAREMNNSRGGGDQSHPDQQGAPAAGIHQLNEHVHENAQVHNQPAKSQLPGAPDGAPGPPPSGGPPPAGGAAPSGGAPPPGAAPAPGAAPSAGGAPPPDGGGGGGFPIALKNNSQGSKILAYRTGQALDNNNTLLILSSDGEKPIYPPNPSGPNTPFSQDCGIDLGPPGSTRSVSIPLIAGGRIWFAVDGELQFGVNPSPALQELSITNQSDPNFHTNWGFCELTYSPQQLYANISHVDFVGIPIALELTTTSSGTQTVQGLAPGGLDQITQGLDSRVPRTNKAGKVGGQERQYSPACPLSESGMVVNPGLFATYFDDTVDQVWTRFRQQQMTVDTQAAAGKVTGHVSGHALVLGGVSISKPTTHDNMTCSTGPFALPTQPRMPSYRA